VKAIRVCSFVFALSLLAGAAVGTLAEIVAFAGFVGGAQAIFNDPSILKDGFYQLLGELGTNYQFFGEYGPFVAVALLILVAINSIT
jgi:hypothetical protein